MRGRKWKQEGGQAVMLSGGALPHQLSPPVSPRPSRQRFLIFWRGWGHILQSAPDAICGPAPQKCTHTSHKPQGSTDPRLGSPLLARGARPPPARPCPSPRPLTWKEWKRYQKAQALTTL